MSTDRAAANADRSAETSGAMADTRKSVKTNSVILVSYPKFIFMYPTVVLSIVTAIVMLLGGYSTVDPATQTVPVVMTGLFLVVLMANTFVIIFDFPRANSLILVFVLTTIGLSLWILTIMKPNLLPTIENLLLSIRPAANTTFFVCFASAMSLLYLAVLFASRFNYWELRNNELLHHHGFLSDLVRYPAPNLRIDKEINDVFEFMLLGAGRLVLHPSSETRAIVLDNVLFVENKEQELTRVLGSLKVQIGTDSSAANQ